jgi:Leucine-rich repeat (LRR) protein
VAGGGRRLESIEPVCKYSALTVLWVTNFGLEVLPDELWKLALVELVVSNNKITEVPDSYVKFRTLKTVRLNDNLLKKLPWQFRNCKLEAINLAYNPELSLRDQFIEAKAYLEETRPYDTRKRRRLVE